MDGEDVGSLEASLRRQLSRRIHSGVDGQAAAASECLFIQEVFICVCTKVFG